MGFVITEIWYRNIQKAKSKVSANHTQSSSSSRPLKNGQILVPLRRVAPWPRMHELAHLLVAHAISCLTPHQKPQAQCRHSEIPVWMNEWVNKGTRLGNVWTPVIPGFFSSILLLKSWGGVWATLFNIVAAGHMWLVSPWNMAIPNWYVHENKNVNFSSVNLYIDYMLKWQNVLNISY